MVLDPVTALGVAGNIVQFVDFGCKLISNGFELYRNGNLVKHAQLAEHARQLHDFNAILEEKLRRLPHVDQAEDEDGMTGTLLARKQRDALANLLRVAIDNCNQCATDLLDAIFKLTVSGSHTKWQSFRHALSSILGDNGLDLASQRLFRAQQNVTLFLILYTRYFIVS
jgi:hypothetical protein